MTDQVARMRCCVLVRLKSCLRERLKLAPRRVFVRYLPIEKRSEPQFQLYSTRAWWMRCTYAVDLYIRSSLAFILPCLSPVAEVEERIDVSEKDIAQHEVYMACNKPGSTQNIKRYSDAIVNGSAKEDSDSDNGRTDFAGTVRERPCAHERARAVIDARDVRRIDGVDRVCLVAAHNHDRTQ